MRLRTTASRTGVGRAIATPSARGARERLSAVTRAAVFADYRAHVQRPVAVVRAMKRRFDERVDVGRHCQRVVLADLFERLPEDLAGHGGLGMDSHLSA